MIDNRWLVSIMLKTPVIGKNGVVAAEHPTASLIGLDVLRKGGNAFDATIATSFALSVLQPHLGGLGSDFFALFYSAEKDKVFCLNSSGWAPKELTINKLADQGYKEMPKKGPHTVTIPGLVYGLNELHKNYGTFEWQNLIKDSIDLASSGFPVYWGLSRAIKVLSNELSKDRGFRKYFLPNENPPNPGQILRQTDLANTLRLVSNDPMVFYKGEVAEKIVEYLTELGGMHQLSDFAEFKPEWCNPISIDYRGTKVYEIPPNSMGATSLLLLNLLEELEIWKYDFSSKARILRTIEAAKIAYRERDNTLADPRFVKVDIKRFISKNFARELLEQAKIGLDRYLTTGDTTYFAVADKEGNMVSAIQSLFYPFGSGLVVDGLGIPLNARGSYFKFYGPNKLEPRKRSLHTLSALLLEKDNEVFAALGASGGDFRPQQHALFVTNIIDYKMPLWKALEAPRFLWNGKKVIVEEGLEIPPHKEYEKISYPGKTGVAQGIIREENVLIGYCDTRGDGLPASY